MELTGIKVQLLFIIWLLPNHLLNTTQLNKMAFKETDYNKIIKLDLPFIHRGIKYPANWLRLTTLDEKKAIGIVEVPD